jgi:IPT/TIG domain
MSRLPASVSAGAVLIILGGGFLSENTVRIGVRPVQASGENGRLLRCYVPVDMPPGSFQLTVENARGTSNSVQLEVRPPAPLQIKEIHGTDQRQNERQSFHPGQKVWVTGSGFLRENTIWFGTRAVPLELLGDIPGTLSLGSPGMLRLVIPDSLPPGTYDLYVSNAAGKSNLIQVHIE